MAVDNVKDYLTGRRVWILSECIYRPPSDEVIRQSCKSLRQRRQPFRCGAAVIIRKGEEPAARPLDTLVARRGGSAVAGRDEADGKAILNSCTVPPGGDDPPSSTTITSNESVGNCCRASASRHPGNSAGRK